MTRFIDALLWPPPRDHLILIIPFAAIASLSYGCLTHLAYLRRSQRASEKGKAASSNALGLSLEEVGQSSKEISKALLQNLDGVAILTFRCLRLAVVTALFAHQAVQIFTVLGGNLDYALLTNYVSFNKLILRLQIFMLSDLHRNSVYDWIVFAT